MIADFEFIKNGCSRVPEISASRLPLNYFIHFVRYIWFKLSLLGEFEFDPSITDSSSLNHYFPFDAHSKFAFARLLFLLGAYFYLLIFLLSFQS